MVQQNAEIEKAAVSDELINAFAEFAEAVQTLADYAGKVKTENPKCDYMQYMKNNRKVSRRRKK